MSDSTRRWNYGILLGSLVVLAFMYPVLGMTMGETGSEAGSPLGGFLWTFSFWVVLFSALRAMKCSLPVLRVAMGLAALAVILSGTAILVGQLAGHEFDTARRVLSFASPLVSLAFLTLTTYEVLRDVLLIRRINTNRIFGAACVYVMLGLTWAFAFQLLHLIHPEAFSFLPRTKMSSEHPFDALQQLIYFSFVTLTTLGYGDIRPISPTARLLASAEALVGQLYLTILVARLVGLHLRDLDWSTEGRQVR